MIKFGVCTAPENAPLVAQLGFDYIECAVTGIAALSDEEFARVREGILQSPIRMEAANVMMPGDIRLTGDQADLSPVPAYFDGVLPRIAELGCKVVVFGSGRARKMPEGYSRDKAWDQVAEFLALAGDSFAKYNLHIAIEPLNTGEDNVINSVSEGLAVANRVNHPNVGVLADWYHITKENEGVDGILAAGEKLWHTHVINPFGRSFPKNGDGDIYDEFFKALSTIGYDHRMSIEGIGEVAQDGAEALSRLHGLVGR